MLTTGILATKPTKAIRPYFTCSAQVLWKEEAFPSLIAYTFKNRGGSCSYRVWKEQTKGQLFGLMCKCGRLCSFVLVCACHLCRVQYGKYFPSSLHFATYFTSLYMRDITAKYMKLRKYLPILHEALCNDYFYRFNPCWNRACLIRCNTKLVQTSRNKNCKTNLTYLCSKHSIALYFHDLIRIVYTLFI